MTWERWIDQVQMKFKVSYRNFWVFFDQGQNKLLYNLFHYLTHEFKIYVYNLLLKIHQGVADYKIVF